MFLEDPDKSGARTLFYDTILYLGLNPDLLLLKTLISAHDLVDGSRNHIKKKQSSFFNKLTLLWAYI